MISDLAVCLIGIGHSSTDALLRLPDLELEAAGLTLEPPCHVMRVAVHMVIWVLLNIVTQAAWAELDFFELKS
jgi:hypothetical protein